MHFRRECWFHSVGIERPIGMLGVTMWVVPLATSALIFLLMIIGRPRSFAAVAPHNRFTATENLDPNEVLEAAISLGQLPRYRLLRIDEANGKVIVEQPLSLLRWGGLFEVEVLPQGAGGQSVINVAAIGHGFQFGGAIRRSKYAFLEALHAAVSDRRRAPRSGLTIPQLDPFP